MCYTLSIILFLACFVSASEVIEVDNTLLTIEREGIKTKFPNKTIKPVVKIQKVSATEYICEVRVKRIRKKIKEGTANNSHNIVIDENWESIIAEAYKPSLPKTKVVLGLPLDQKVTLETIESSYKEYSNISIAPSIPEILDTDWEARIAIEYAKDALFPSILVSIPKIEYFGSSKNAVFEVFPVRYNPLSKVLRVDYKISFKVKLEPDVQIDNRIKNIKISRFAIEGTND